MEVGKWEEEHERRFLINGCHYMDIITNQWAAFNAQKEQEKLERVRNKKCFQVCVFILLRGACYKGES